MSSYKIILSETISDLESISVCPFPTIHPVILSSLALLAFSAQAQTTTPPNEISEFYDIYDHVECDIASISKMIVEADNVSKCQNFLGPAVSIKLTQVAEGCKLKLEPVCLTHKLFRSTSRWNFCEAALLTE